jgi:hypothetical protein
VTQPTDAEVIAELDALRDELLMIRNWWGSRLTEAATRELRHTQRRLTRLVEGLDAE